MEEIVYETSVTPQEYNQLRMAVGMVSRPYKPSSSPCKISTIAPSTAS